MKHALTPTDILPLDEYERVRPEKRGAMLAIKKNRRVSVGPYAMFYFENYDTMWLQVQEMLRIEKGGDEQLQDELRAYNPLLPQGNELVATVMFEIEDPAKRKTVLASIGGVQDTTSLRFDGETIKGEPEKDLDYTAEEGKASSVQFGHCRFTAEQIKKFRSAAEIVVAINHANYRHMAVMSQPVKEQLLKDFSS